MHRRGYKVAWLLLLLCCCIVVILRPWKGPGRLPLRAWLKGADATEQHSYRPHPPTLTEDQYHQLVDQDIRAARQAARPATEQAIKAAEERLEAEQQIGRVYLPIISSIGLNNDQLEALKRCLLDRALTIDDIYEIGRASGLTGQGLRVEVDNLVKSNDDQIRAIVGDNDYQTIEQMLSLNLQLAPISNSLEPEMEFAGAPMNGPQRLALAQVMKDIYNPPGGSSGYAYRAAGYDPSTGLSAKDKEAIARASAFLSQQQLTVLAQQLAYATGVAVSNVSSSN